VSFDSEVKIGEIRVFADTKGPLVALVLDARGLAGFRIAPVSPYRIPANDAEVAIGERVFQVWNVCTAAKGFVERSWIADTLSAEDLERVREAVAAQGGLPKTLGEYERRQLAAGGDFKGWSAKLPRPSVARWRQYGGWSIAAALVVGLGAAWLLVREEPGPAETARVMTVQMERPQKFPELEVALKEPTETPEPLPEVEVAVPLPEAPVVATVESAPDIRRAPEVGKLTPAAEARLKPMSSDAVVAGRLTAGDREPEVVRMLDWLKETQKEDGSWGDRPLVDTALAVLALMAHGETADSADYGPALVRGIRFLAEAELDGRRRSETQIVACALCGASVAVRNPNVRTAAERALAAIGENRSVESGRDWRGLLAAWEASAPGAKSHDTRLSSGPAEADPVADACIFVLRLLAE
jgi:hypothetical protein